jgi:MoxR-like ATPase
MFASVQDAVKKLAGQKYICSREVATVVYLACAMRRPLLVEGPAGVGKTEIAKAIAGASDLDLIRLQCYEGLDEAKALYEWEYTKQLLYTQILKDKIGEVLSAARDLREAVECIAKEDDIFFSEKFLLPRPLLRALVSPQPTVLLVDEVDKSDTEFEAFLLEVLSDFQISVPEIGTLKAKHIPFVILTSNNSREMSDALKRRCLHLHLDFPSPKTEAAIIKLKVPDAGRKLAEDVVRFIYRLRRLDLKKAPSISESLDWVSALVLLNLRNLAGPKVRDTLGSLLKYEGDARKAADELKKFLAERTVRTSTSKSAGEKDLLH